MRNYNSSQYQREETLKQEIIQYDQVLNNRVNPRSLAATQTLKSKKTVQEYSPYNNKLFEENFQQSTFQQEPFRKTEKEVQVLDQQQSGLKHLNLQHNGVSSQQQVQVNGDQDNLKYYADENLNVLETDPIEFNNLRDIINPFRASNKKYQEGDKEEAKFESKPSHINIVDQFIQHYNENPINVPRHQKQHREVDIFNDPRMIKDIEQNRASMKQNKILQKKKEHFEKQLDDILANKYYEMMLKDNEEVKDGQNRVEENQMDLVSMNDFNYQATESDIFQSSQKLDDFRNKSPSPQNVQRKQQRQQNIYHQPQREQVMEYQPNKSRIGFDQFHQMQPNNNRLLKLLQEDNLKSPNMHEKLQYQQQPGPYMSGASLQFNSVPMVLSRGSSLHFKPHFDINNSKIQSKYGAEEARDQAIHTNTIISTEQPPINQEDIYLKPLQQEPQIQRRSEENGVPARSKPVWKSIEEEIKKENKAGVLKEQEIEDHSNNQLDTSRMRKLNTNNGSSQVPPPPPPSTEEDADKKERPQEQQKEPIKKSATSCNLKCAIF